MQFSLWGPLISMSIDDRRADGMVLLQNRGSQKSLLHDIFLKKSLLAYLKYEPYFIIIYLYLFFIILFKWKTVIWETWDTPVVNGVSSHTTVPGQLGLHKSPVPPTDQPKEEINFLEYHAESASYVLGFARFIQVLEFDTCTIPCSLVMDLHDCSMKENYFEKHFHLARYIMVLWRICFLLSIF